MQETMSIVKPQKYMNPHTLSSVKSTHNKIQKHVCGSAINIAVVAITHISAKIIFRRTSCAINLSVTHVLNILLQIVTNPSIPVSLAIFLVSSIAGIHSCGPENFLKKNSIVAIKIGGAFSPHLSFPLKRKFI